MKSHAIPLTTLDIPMPPVKPLRKTGSFTTDGYTYDCTGMIYQFICTTCQEPFYSDKPNNYCPCCGTKFTNCEFVREN